MSKQKTPVLAGAIPSFEHMMTCLERLSVQQPMLAPAIKAGLKVTYKYYKKMDNTLSPCVSPSFTSPLAAIQEDHAVLHPGIWMVWIQKNWGDEYVKNAEIQTALIHLL